VPGLKYRQQNTVNCYPTVYKANNSTRLLQVTITAEQECLYMCWPRLRLERVLRHRPPLKVVLSNIIGDPSQCYPPSISVSGSQFCTLHSRVHLLLQSKSTVQIYGIEHGWSNYGRKGVASTFNVLQQPQHTNQSLEYAVRIIITSESILVHFHTCMKCVHSMRSYRRNRFILSPYKIIAH
jgi:hypothetical protein